MFGAVTVDEDRQELRGSSLTCFTIGPIGNQLDPPGSEGRLAYEEALEVWAEVIEPACRNFGLSPVRADGLTRAGEITEQIFKRLRDDDVVIADLTGANANVMYELGLRHTRDVLTLQVGEYGRLPFDVNVIRTVLFSRSSHGLVKARKELEALLEAGLAGEYDPVSATRIWCEPSDGPAPTADPPVVDIDDSIGLESDAEEPGFIDLLATGEESQEKFNESIENINLIIERCGELATASSAEMSASDARGGGMRGRLAVLGRFSYELGKLATEVEGHVYQYETSLLAVSGANGVLIARMESDPEALAEGQEFGMTIRRLAEISRESFASVSGFVEVMRENAKMSKVLRGPTSRMSDAMVRFIATNEIIDDWDRRLQALGIPVPTEDLEPPADEGPLEGQPSGS